ncbi:MAG: VCBS repeat-containing protein [Thermodesulfovibrio sp.]|nr:VCBS repeat-containing protein [Thermodesulfovibrio sp.]MDW7972721.1 VCBS repeat-containing protein [Thermodesulfovibrio sp.]
MCFKKISIFVFLCLVFFLTNISHGQTNYFKDFKETLLSYFPVVSGKVTNLENNELSLDKGSKDGIKKGQRVVLFEETVPLIHPVTRQVIGKSEKIVGTAEVVSVEENSSKATIIEGSISSLKNDSLLFKIPKSKIKVLYAQSDTEWAVGEGYYRELKNTERFELIDAPINIKDAETLLKNSQNADILLFLKQQKLNGNIKLTQEIYWIKDKKLLIKSETELSPKLLSELRKKYASLIVPEGHTLLSFRLSRGINRVATGNFDGISQNQVLIISDSEISLYLMNVDLKLKSNYVIPIGGDMLWFDTGDIDKDGKDEIVMTIKKDDRVFSSIVKWIGDRFEEVSRINDIFLRIYDDRLIAQAYSPSEGFYGEIFYINPQKSDYQKNETLKLPVKANIYDFYVLGDTVFKWENDGSLAVYNNKGVPLWRSQEPMGFGMQYEKHTGVAMLSLGKWQVQSRIKPLSNGVIVIEKKPLLGAVNISTLGYRSSKLQLLQWTGIGIEQMDITEEMSGEILDYAISSDKIFVLVKPPFGFNPRRILQGESPFETILHVLSLKY